MFSKIQNVSFCFTQHFKQLSSWWVLNALQFALKKQSEKHAVSLLLGEIRTELQRIILKYHSRHLIFR